MPNIHNYEKQLKGIPERLSSNPPCEHCREAEKKRLKKAKLRGFEGTLKTENCYCRMRKEDKEDLLKFYTQLMAEGKTAGRVLKVLYTIKTLSYIMKKPFRYATKDDMVRTVAEVGSNEDWSDWTKRDTKIILRMFFKFIKGTENYPDEVKWIKARDSSKRLLPDDVLKEDEVKKIAENMTNSRDKAFVLALYESGSRIGEFLGIRIKNVSFDEYGTVFRVSGKTGDRRIRIVASTPAIKDWIDSHPYKSNPEAFLWLRENSKSPYKFLSYIYVLYALRVSAKKAGIFKKINPHAFRHARGTFLANKFTDRQMKEFFGWSRSETISTYTHLSGRDLDEAVLKQYGIVTNGNSQPVIALKVCERCKETNDPVSKLCKKCYMPLDINEKRQVLDNVIFDFLSIIAEKYPDVKGDFRRIVKEKGLEGVFQ